MATAYIEELRTTRYRQRLAALLRRPSCRWISFAIGAAPIHRSFFAETAAAIEGQQTGGARLRNGVNHRQVQYGVRLRIAEDADRATYDSECNQLVVPRESAFDTLDGQQHLLSACVHVGLKIKGRHRHELDSEYAARIAGHLYRLFENIAGGDSEAEVAAKLRRLEPEAPQDKAFYAAAREILQHLRATSLTALRGHRRLEAGSFMKIIGIAQRDRLHRLLQQAVVRTARTAPKPHFIGVALPSRFLALQEMEPAVLTAA
jgi:hypothetical protein